MQNLTYKSLSQGIAAVLVLVIGGAGCSSSSDNTTTTGIAETDTPAEQVLSDAETSDIAQGIETPDDTGTDNTGTDNTGTDNTGTDNTGTDNTGTDDTGTDDTGTDDTGTDDTGTDDTGTDDTGTDDTGLRISPDNANALILQAFEVYSGRAYDRRMTDFPYTTTETFELSSGNGQTGERLTFSACQNSGQMTQTNNSGKFDYSVEGVYSDCLINGDTLNGRVTLQDEDGEGDAFSQRVYSDNFTVAFQPGGRMTLSGVQQQANTSRSTNVFNVERFNFALSYPGGELSVSDANTTRSVKLAGFPSGSMPIAQMSGSFTMQPPVLNGTTITVETNEPFVNSQTASSLRYETGVMTLTDGEGHIVVNADTGNINTVSVTTTVDGQTTVTREEPWFVWRDALAYVPPNPNAAPEPNLTTQRNDIITPDNANAIMREAFDVLTGDLFGSEMLNLPEYTFPDFPEGYLQAATPDGAQEWGTQSCANGGSVDLESFKFGARQITSGWNATFNECDQNNNRYTGQFFTRNFGNFNYSGNNFSLASPNRTVSLDGSVDYKHTSNRDGGPSRHYGLSGDITRLVTEANSQDFGEYKAIQAQTYFEAVLGFQLLMTGEFYYSSPSTKSETLQISIPDPLIQRNNIGGLLTQYRYGTLVIKAGQGNELMLNATNGDDNTFDLTVRQGGQITYSSNEAWSDWTEALTFNFDLHLR